MTIMTRIIEAIHAIECGHPTDFEVIGDCLFVEANDIHFEVFIDAGSPDYFERIHGDGFDFGYEESEIYSDRIPEWDDWEYLI